MARFRGISPWLGVAVLSFLTGCGAVFINQGSKDASLASGLKNPAPPKAKVEVSKDQCLIANFDDGSKNMNSKLYGAHGGMWMALSTGGGGAINSDFIVDGGANSTPKAIHVFGSLTDKGDKAYPGFQVQGKFMDNGYYDASNFTGLQFYYKCPEADTCVKRRFGIGTAPTLPPDAGGTCSGNCWDHYGCNLLVNDNWVKYTLVFADTKREGWGGPVTPPDLIDHLAEFVALTWTHQGNNAAGTYTVDYWVDEVEFF